MEAPGDSPYPFDLWSGKRGRAFLGHANSSRHKYLPLLPPLCVELISLPVRGREDFVRKSGGWSVNERGCTRLSGPRWWHRVNGLTVHQRGDYLLSVMAEILIVEFDWMFLKWTDSEIHSSSIRPVQSSLFTTSLCYWSSKFLLWACDPFFSLCKELQEGACPTSPALSGLTKGLQCQAPALQLPHL